MTDPKAIRPHSDILIERYIARSMKKLARNEKTMMRTYINDNISRYCVFCRKDLKLDPYNDDAECCGYKLKEAYPAKEILDRIMNDLIEKAML